MDFLDNLQSLPWRCVAFMLFICCIKLARKIKQRFINEEEENRAEYTGCEERGCVRCRRITHRDSLDSKLMSEGSWRVGEWLESQDGREDDRPVLFELPGLDRCTPFVDACDHLNSVETLEANWEVMRDECMQIIGGAFDEQPSCGTWKLNLTPGSDGGWSVFYLFNQGREWEENSRFCRRTMEILGELEDVLDNCSFGNVAFSVLLPNTTIPAHHGPTNTRSRCHLGLQTPPGCSLFVDGTEKNWKEGNVCYSTIPSSIL